MDSFVWGSQYITGLPVIDKQHQHLVRIINQFGEQLADCEFQNDSLDILFNQLVEYAAFHFKEEEDTMASFQVDERHVQKHLKAHQMFVEEMSGLYDLRFDDSSAKAQSFFKLLISWLAYHILDMDQEMARQIDDIQAGYSPADAYNQHQVKKNSSTEPLVNALNHLVEHLSLQTKVLKKLNATLEEKVAKRTEDLSLVNKHLKELSLTDVLTGLPNRRYAMRALEDLWTEAIIKKSHLSCMMIDADHFKEVNDQYGHDAGDDVLVALAQNVKKALGNRGILSRLGGDEFFVLCPDMAADVCDELAEVIRRSVSELVIATGQGAWQGSVSIGVASKSILIVNSRELIRAADRHMVEAKQAGKNCVRGAHAS